MRLRLRLWPKAFALLISGALLTGCTSDIQKKTYTVKSIGNEATSPVSFGCLTCTDDLRITFRGNTFQSQEVFVHRREAELVRAWIEDRAPDAFTGRTIDFLALADNGQHLRCQVTEVRQGPPIGACRAKDGTVLRLTGDREV